MIRLNIFASAYDKVPTEYDLEWAEACELLTDLATSGAADKRQLPAFSCAKLREPYNTNENVEYLTALPIDVDTCDGAAVIERIEALKIAALVYASPSDPNPDGSRRLRVLVSLDAPLAPESVKHARKALAEMIGIGPGQGVERADAESQIMFAGKIRGTDDRDLATFGGEPVSTAALVSAKLAEPWSNPKAATKVKALERLAIEDPDERTIALLDALTPHWEAPGESTQRRQVLRALGGYLARRGWTDEQIAAVGRGLETERPDTDRIELMIDCARQTRASDGETGAGWSGLCEWSPEAAAVIESVAKDPLEPADFVGVFDASWRAAYARPGSWVNRGRERREAAAQIDPLATAGTVGATEADAPRLPLILHDRRFGMLDLLWEGDDRGYHVVAKNSLRLRIRELGFDQSFISLVDDKKRPRTPENLIEGYGSTFVNTAYAFGNSSTIYDPAGEGTVTVGYPTPAIAPRFDADADEWLRALGGQHYDRLCVWIASCAQGNIDRLAACLVMIGRADSGKSMFGHAVAKLWGSRPVAAARMVSEFNAEMRNSPILADEEAQLFGSKQLSTKKFRDEIQAPERSIQYKGKERVPLIGALRLIVSCNGLSDLKFADLGGSAVVEALRDRFLVIDALTRAEACKVALAKLRVIGKYVVDLERIAGHMAWIIETTELPAERFLGSGGEDAAGAILAGHVDETIDVWESFRDWLLGNGVGGPWRVLPEGLALDTAALSATLENVGRGWDHRAVRAAAAPVKVRDIRPRLADDSRPRLWLLDALRLADAVGLDAEELAELERRLDQAETAPNQPRNRFGRF